ncbi:hypothetical protein SLEP1_g53229 [Rubroshorea leprosula]|uniref:Uncharacterized protein n=1 Tax=Rubroshorea leprosula TaxID=152421 RepID=A0AAV5M9N6_9ROSI|nr:hypothetical protein SLEP1_g53229 [Rubroshorea leprosula]
MEKFTKQLKEENPCISPHLTPPRTVPAPRAPRPTRLPCTRSSPLLHQIPLPPAAPNPRCLHACTLCQHHDPALSLAAPLLHPCCSASARYSSSRQISIIID